MKNKKFICLLVLGFITCFAVNSCKKSDLSNIPNLLTAGDWQLASLQVTHYVGDNRISIDTLNTECDTTQIFRFNKDNTCTYTNFACKPQPTATGTWALSRDKLTLKADMVCQDNTKEGSSKPFNNAQVINLGQFSFVIETGDINPYYTSTQVRAIARYGFVRQKTSAK
jgi:hypothetical protein